MNDATTTRAPVRPGDRTPDQLRPVAFEPDFVRNADASVLAVFGNTRVICTASIESSVPRWMEGRGSGWVTAEYAMLPASTGSRKQRDSKSGRQDGRSVEIQRLIGRSLRAVVDRRALGERSIVVDCDVLDADGGTRCAAICGGWVALHRAMQVLVDRGEIESIPLTETVSAVSVGIVGGLPVLDLEYVEDSTADVDMNLVTTGDGRFIEIQSSAEGNTFSREEFDQLLQLGIDGCRTITQLQVEACRA